jgi:hypothetical protein
MRSLCVLPLCKSRNVETSEAVFNAVSDRANLLSEKLFQLLYVLPSIFNLDLNEQLKT